MRALRSQCAFSRRPACAYFRPISDVAKRALDQAQSGRKIADVADVSILKMTVKKSLPVNLAFRATTESDADTLVSIRIAAMRESLERIGRFDPQRARERFLASFDPALCRFIEADGIQTGFILIRPQQDHWLLDHLYILPEHQGRGIGAAVLSDIIKSADAQCMPIRLGALRGSDSNHFYRRHGFVQTDEAEWDIYYVRHPS
jgi:GNAT superfamily N-acetyltransferase